MIDKVDMSDEAVLRRSQAAARELAVAARSAKVKRMLDRAAARKAKGTLKEFSELRGELVEDLQEHVNVPHSSMPPNILILKRQTVRQFPNKTMVALYYNDKLDQYFSIPYGGDADSIVTPVALAKEEHQVGDKVHYRIGSSDHMKAGKIVKVEAEHVVVHRAEPHGGKYGYHYKVHKSDVVDSTVKEEVIQEGVLSHLERVKSFQTDKPLFHHDGSQTKIDPQTANALLTVHGALHPTNQKKFTDALEHSKTKFHKMVDFSWKQVK